LLGDEKGEFVFELECKLEVALDDGRGDVLLGVLKGLLRDEKELIVRGDVLGEGGLFIMWLLS